MKILIACEESQRVCIAFRENGHEAYSCDIQECSGERPEWHILGDCLPLLNGKCEFVTQNGEKHLIENKWDMIIAHPPCTRLCNSGQRWLYWGDNEYQTKKKKDQEEAIAFFMQFVHADCDKIAIENPCGIMSSIYRQPDQIYNPYDFQGETECKKTCLWLKGLQPLKATQILPKEKRTQGIWKAHFDGKSGSLTGTNRQNAVAEPVNITADGKAKALRASADKDGIRNFVGNENDKRTCVAERVYYGAEAVEFDESGKPTKARSYADGKIYTVYEVRDGKITIKGKEYPIKLADGFYIIRKLTVTECCRLQTLPDDYCRAVSASQGYKGCGNGWTAEVIIHILSHALKDIPRDTPIKVLSMYDGIGTGRYCLDKMGFTNVEYHAYEIDKYAMKIAMSNYPDIIQHGDAFAVRNDDWKL